MPRSLEIYCSSMIILINIILIKSIQRFRPHNKTWNDKRITKHVYENRDQLPRADLVAGGPVRTS